MVYFYVCGVLFLFVVCFGRGVSMVVMDFVAFWLGVLMCTGNLCLC